MEEEAGGLAVWQPGGQVSIPASGQAAQVSKSVANSGEL